MNDFMDFSDYLDCFYVIDINNVVINEVKAKLKTAIRKSWPIYVMGNGGSAYTANHFVQDLIKVCGATKAISLSENIGLIMAIANDMSYDDVFSFQLENKVQIGDDEGLFIAISYSGNSKNIINAASYMNYATGMPIISMTGNDGGNLAKMSDYNINVETPNIYLAESYHSLLCHYFVEAIDKEL